MSLMVVYESLGYANIPERSSLISVLFLATIPKFLLLFVQANCAEEIRNSVSVKLVGIQSERVCLCFKNEKLIYELHQQKIIDNRSLNLLEDFSLKLLSTKVDMCPFDLISTNFFTLRQVNRNLINESSL